MRRFFPRVTWLLPVGIATLVSFAPMAGAQAPSSGQSAMQAELDRAEALATRARAAAKAGRAKEAIALFEESFAIQEGRLLPAVQAANPEIGFKFMLALTGDKLELADQYMADGQTQKAVDVIEKQIRLHEALGDKDTYAAALPKWRAFVQKERKAAPPAADPREAEINRAIDLIGKGKKDEAAEILERVLPTFDTGPTGTFDDDTLSLFNTLAGRLLDDTFLYTRAEQRYLRALALAEKKGGAGSELASEAALALAVHYVRANEEERAAPHALRAHDGLKKKGGSTYTTTISVLARIVDSRGDFAEAAQLQEHAIKLQEEGLMREPSAKAVRDRAITMALQYVQLATIYDDGGQFEKAEALYGALVKSVPADADRSSDTGPLWATLYESYATHFLRWGKPTQAVGWAEQAKRLRERTQSGDAEALANAECTMGETYWAAGDLGRSLDPIFHCFDVREKTMLRMLATGAEEQKLAAVNQFVQPYQKTMTAVLRANGQNPKLVRGALRLVLRTKGRVLEAASGDARTRTSGDPETQKLVRRLASVRTLMAGLANSGGAPGEVSALEEEGRTLEAAISLKSPDFKNKLESADENRVQSALTPDAALVELVSYRALDSTYKKEDEVGTRYMAFVLRSQGEPVAVDLGPSAAIDADIAVFRKSAANPRLDPAGVSRSLHRRVMGPLLPYLVGVRTLYVSPDGLLNNVPFAALVDDAGKGMIDSFAVSYVTSGRDLMRFAKSNVSVGDIAVFANPTYDLGGQRRANTTLARIDFPPLPGTEIEARVLQNLFPGARVLTGKDATEEAVKSVSHPSVLHLATHGYFLRDRTVAPKSSRAVVLVDDAPVVIPKSENPLLRSGLAFAGAKGLVGKGGAEDGVLTALEAASLDLSGTKLVVLSACQTALGDEKNSEGVYGLRRAFTLAGAESEVMSLWSVDDETTSFLMRGYYERLKKGMGRAEALRDVQRVLAANKDTSHPYYWAAFIPSGDPSPMAFPESAQHAAPEPSRPTPRDDKDDPPFFEPRPPSVAWWAVNVGIGQNTITPRAAGGTELSSLGVDFRGEVSPLSFLFDSYGTQSIGFSIFDRAGFSYSLPIDDGNVSRISIDYTAMLGYRTAAFGLFGGARYNGISIMHDSGDASGMGMPLAARLELPWFFESRLQAQAYGLTVLGDVDMVGAEVRVPMFAPYAFLNAGTERVAGRPEQDRTGTTYWLTLGLGGTQ
jgi:CHAT domain-containing protein/tetratricopeptide (TPR) repeat protein